jgi:hypothetical protein
MPRKVLPKLCSCGCNELTRGGEFIPGHDSKVYSAIISHVGGISNLRKLVEASTGEPIIVHPGLRLSAERFKFN